MKQNNIEITDNSLRNRNSAISINQKQSDKMKKIIIPKGSHKIEMEMIRYLLRNQIDDEKSLRSEQFKLNLQQQILEQRHRASSVSNNLKKNKNINEIKNIYLQNYDSKKNSVRSNEN